MGKKFWQKCGRLGRSPLRESSEYVFYKCICIHFVKHLVVNSFVFVVRCDLIVDCALVHMQLC